MMYADDDVVLMPVPLTHAMAVRSLLRQLESGGEASAATEPDQPTTETSLEIPGQGSWSVQDLHTLLEHTPYPGVVALGDLCAARAGEWIPKDEVEAAGGITPIQLRNELGAFSKAAKRVLGRLQWPFEWKKEKGSYFYRMPDEMAAWWLAERESAG